MHADTIAASGSRGWIDRALRSDSFATGPDDKMDRGLAVDLLRVFQNLGHFHELLLSLRKLFFQSWDDLVV